MKKIALFIPILFIGIVLFQCSKTDIDQMPLPQNLNSNIEGVLIDSISTRSESLGIKSYTVISRNTISNENITDIIEFEILSKTGKRRIVIESNDSGTLKVKADKKWFENLSLVELNYNNMSLTASIKDKGHVLYLKNHYRDEVEYQKAKEVFDNNKHELEVLLSSSIDIMKKYNIRIADKQSNSISPLNNNLGDTIPTMYSLTTSLCPEGTTFVTHTSYDASRSVATTFSMNTLQGTTCSNAYCIGCSSTFGTDCMCIFQDYGCACTSKGCACSRPIDYEVGAD